MTEEIIIDGVNVKDCRRRIGKENFCRYYKRGCADNNYNCIWKKCLRLEQENARLKNERTADLVRQIDELKAENERLKEEISIARENYGLEMEFQMRYRKALEEIRELFCVGRTFYEGYFDNENLSRGDKAIKIINEVLK